MVSFGYLTWGAIMLRRFKYSFLFTLLSFIVLTVIFSFENHHSIITYKMKELNLLQREANTIEVLFKSISSDLRFISNMYELQLFIDSVPNSSLESIQNEFVQFGRAKKEYAQIRYLDHRGNEIVRVDFKDGIPFIIPDGKLQNKKDRYYFKDAIILGKDGIYVSPFDLNIENGEIEKPLNPMIRFAQPVYSRKGEKRGIVVLNYRGEEILNHIRKKTGISKRFLLNSDSYFLMGPTPRDEWGFMFEERFHRNMQQYYPDVWKSIKYVDEGSVFNDSGFFIYHTVSPLLSHFQSTDGTYLAKGSSSHSVDSAEYQWKLISYLPFTDFKELSYKRFIKYYILSLFVSVILAHVYALLKERAVRVEKELARSMENLEIRNQELATAINTKNRFFSIIGHDLRNPIHVVIGYVSLLIENYDNMSISEIKEYFGDIETATQKLLKLLENLLDWARSQTGDITPHCKNVEISQLVSKAEMAVAMSAKNKGITLDISIPPRLTTFVDEDMITTVLRNILTNSIKFTERKGKISVTATPLGGEYVQVTITDSGIGISEEQCKNLFNLNSTTSTTGTEGEEGTGLGMILSAEFLSKNNATIEVKSVIGAGSTFIITLPYRTLT